MPKPTQTLDDIFNEVERENEARTAREIAEEQTPEGLARKAADRAKDIVADIRKGLRTPDGVWIEQPEEIEPEDDDDGEDA
jgi:hypothetical protein